MWCRGLSLVSRPVWEYRPAVLMEQEADPAPKEEEEGEEEEEEEEDEGESGGRAGMAWLLLGQWSERR